MSELKLRPPKGKSGSLGSARDDNSRKSGPPARLAKGAGLVVGEDTVKAAASRRTPKGRGCSCRTIWGCVEWARGHFHERIGIF